MAPIHFSIELNCPYLLGLNLIISRDNVESARELLVLTLVSRELLFLSLDELLLGRLQVMLALSGLCLHLR